jgi:hypothetical protein
MMDFVCICGHLQSEHKEEKCPMCGPYTKCEKCDCENPVIIVKTKIL